MSNEPGQHISVMPGEILEFAREALSGRPNPIILDGTLGEGGHTLLFRQNFPGARIIGVDRDEEMLGRAAKRLNGEGVDTELIDRNSFELPEPPRVGLWSGNFSEIAATLEQKSIELDFILLDLGVSIYHFRGAGRGFSYDDDTLDMRLDRESALDAATVLNTFSREELIDIFRNLGEERFSGRIASRIIEARPHSSARELAELILKAVPGQKRGPNRIHPATRIFQALRIYVNDELGAIDSALEQLPARVAPGGMVAIISFHSLEDRAVKLCFRKLGEKKVARTKPPKRYKKVDESNRSSYWILTPRPLKPTEEETQNNPAARSARLRVLQRKVIELDD